MERRIRIDEKERDREKMGKETLINHSKNDC